LTINPVQTSLNRTRKTFELIFGKIFSRFRASLEDKLGFSLILNQHPVQRIDRLVFGPFCKHHSSHTGTVCFLLLLVIEFIRPHIPVILNALFQMINELGTEHVVSVFDTLMDRFGEEIAPWAEGICAKLVRSIVVGRRKKHYVIGAAARNTVTKIQ
jgi:hypothetical protein